MSDDSQISVQTLERFLDAFNAHDLDALMTFFTEDCIVDMPRGPAPWGRDLRVLRTCARGSPPVSQAFQTSTTATTAIGSRETEAAPNGSSPGRRSAGSASKFVILTGNVLIANASP